MSKKAGERYTVAVDFDGVLHSYSSPWVNAHTIPDPPVPGAAEWLFAALQKFDVAIHSTRCRTWRGRRAVRRWIAALLRDEAWKWCNAFVPDLFTHGDVEEAAESLVAERLNQMQFTAEKPPALVYIDDRAWRFEGTFPTADEIHRARPWNKR